MLLIHSAISISSIINRIIFLFQLCTSVRIASRSSRFFSQQQNALFSSLSPQTIPIPTRGRRNTDATITMKVKVGIIGLPNVGKSSLFNSLAKKSVALSANYPFATIEPNVSPIAIPDAYLPHLGRFADSRRTIAATIQFVDVAGLTKGASRGEGLGNKFLATIREADAICHVVRSFNDGNVVHVSGTVEPQTDAEIVNLELILADLAHVERRLEKTACKGEERDILERVREGLTEGVTARSLDLNDEEKFSIKSMGILTLKPVLYVFNVDEVDFFLGRDLALDEAKRTIKSIQYCDPSVDMYTIVSARVESEIATLESQRERVKYMESLGVDDNNFGGNLQLEDVMSYNILPLMVKELLDLSIVYTGPGVPQERSRTTKAHVVFPRGSLTAEGLAGKLHGEIQRGFIRAEVSSAPNLLHYDSFPAAKESGSVRIEGRDYKLEPHDVVLVKWK